MPRQVKRIKPLIYVFYEGESEQQYIDYLKSCFSDVAVIKRCSKRASTNLFADTKSRFEKDKKYRDVAKQQMKYGSFSMSNQRIGQMKYGVND